MCIQPEENLSENVLGDGTTKILWKWSMDVQVVVVVVAAAIQEQHKKRNFRCVSCGYETNR